MKKPEVVVTDAAGFAHNVEPALIMLEISKADVDSGNLASALDRLHILTDSAENTRLYRESLTFSVCGYDNDPRELVEIPEVREFFQKLTAEWPHWLWFLVHGFGSIGLLMALLCKVRVIHATDSYGTEFESKAEVANKMRDLFFRGNALFVAYGITKQESDESAASVVEELIQ